MSSAKVGLSLPFTGERVVPGAVEPDLWNEHVARYRFAALFAKHARVLDLGCGSGYGAATLASSASHTVALDNSEEAIAFAQKQCEGPEFFTASATELPFVSASFDLVTAFEVIEHLADWPILLEEARRVLKVAGVLLVSTPNRLTYSAARGEQGANPFHVHEFDRDEFEQALRKQFRFVRILSQNHQAAVVFSSEEESTAEAFLPPIRTSAESDFFLAVCSQQRVDIPSFVFVPEAANVLREREKHIALMKVRVENLEGDLTSLMAAHSELQAELEDHNAWALGLDRELVEARRQLCQYEIDLRAARQNSDRAQADWQERVDAALAQAASSEEQRHSFEVRLQAAQQHNDNLVAAEGQIRNSAWVRLGRGLNIGPGSNRRFRLSYLMGGMRKRSSQAKLAARRIVLYLASAVLLLISAGALLMLDIAFALFGKRRLPASTSPQHGAASIVIPNWNGRDLLGRFLPDLLRKVAPSSGSEVIVVDNASSDGSVEFLRREFPSVRVIELPDNRGFAGGCHAGVAAAKHEVIVLLNNDMRVSPNFLAPLLQHFSDPDVFAVSSQIFFGDPERRREETGLTETWWDNGFLGVGHRVDPEITVTYPCAYPGGGSSAFDRSKFLELGGFDALFHPFYYEDTDLGRLAWKRGWKVLYEPRSVVFHEHRGTIGKHYSAEHIETVLRKNAILYCWKNVHDWGLLASHFRACLRSGVAPKRTGVVARCSPSDAVRVFRDLRPALRSRWRALSKKAISDREAFDRPLGGYFYDRFLASSVPVPPRLKVLFLSPYPIEPPTHGGAVFMKETLRPLSTLADVHLLSFVDTQEQLPAQESLSSLCKTAQFVVRPHFPIEGVWAVTPCSIQEFGVRDFAWRMHRTIYLQKVDVLQIEYTILGQYAGAFRHLPCFLFEHDISVQSLGRQLATSRWNFNLLIEYLRMRIYEPRLLTRFSRVQVCSEANARFLTKLVPALKGRVDADVRAAIDTRRYPFVTISREPDTLLFLGSFRHSPNLDALRWFTDNVFPAILRQRPSVVLNIVGSDPPQASTVWNQHQNIRLLGAVPDIREPLQRFAVFICPVLSGSGVRVKLLEAFASGIPAVSTRVGAEGLADVSGEVCELADAAEEFAAAVLRLLSDPAHRLNMAGRARRMVETARDSQQATRKLEAVYGAEVRRRRGDPATVDGREAEPEASDLVLPDQARY